MVTSTKSYLSKFPSSILPVHTSIETHSYNHIISSRTPKHQTQLPISLAKLVPKTIDSHLVFIILLIPPNPSPITSRKQMQCNETRRSCNPSSQLVGEVISYGKSDVLQPSSYGRAKCQGLLCIWVILRLPRGPRY